MPDPITIKSLFRTYQVVFQDSPEQVVEELVSPGTFTIADPVALEVLGSDVRLPDGRHYILEPTEEKKTLDPGLPSLFAVESENERERKSMYVRRECQNRRSEGEEREKERG